MRVISGKSKRIKLKNVINKNVRPTTDRIKETLFNIINFYIKDSKVLDLFSGTGAIGIEALSRGATMCVFVDSLFDSINAINFNLEKTKLKEKAVVVFNDVLRAIKTFNNKYVFDIVFIDPPYNTKIYGNVLKELKNNHVINNNTLIIIEEKIDNNDDYINNSDFEIINIKKYKTNKHIFLKLIK